MDLEYAEISGTADLLQGVYVVVVETPEQNWSLKWFKS
jgi:hypothetical protein